MLTVPSPALMEGLDGVFSWNLIDPGVPGVTLLCGVRQLEGPGVLGRLIGVAIPTFCCRKEDYKQDIDKAASE